MREGRGTCATNSNWSPFPGAGLKKKLQAALSLNGNVRAMRSSVKHVLHRGREFVTHWAAAGIIVAATGVAPEHWMARLLDGLHLPGDALHLWSSQIDMRW